jgi:hypothetical protein
MLNEKQIVFGLVTALSGATLIIIGQRQELKQAKAETRRKEAVSGMFERAFHRACKHMSGPQMLDTLYSLEEEGKFQKIIRDM